ncbi:unnamed protein product [Closterium sp. Naga37s-1]|nr:unnamed protein product [Closterium sp. Naga37s-1]
MVIAGVDEPSPERAAAWSAVVAKPLSEPERATTAMKPPLPPAPKPASAVSEKTPPLAHEAPVAVIALVQSEHVAALSPPAVVPAPPADVVVPSVPAPAGAVADPPVPVPGAPVALPASAPGEPALAPALPPKAASATTGVPAPSVAPAAAGQSAPAVTAVAPAGQPSRSPSPDRRSSRPHSPAPHQDRKSSRRRRESPRRYQQESHWGSRGLEGSPRSWRGLHALLLIQVLAHSSLPLIPPESFRGRQRDSCLDAADQLAVLLVPVLAAPVEGGAATAGQLDEAVRGLRRHLRAGSGAAAIGASTLVVRELWRSLTGVLHALGAHRM